MRFIYGVITVMLGAFMGLGVQASTGWGADAPPEDLLKLRSEIQSLQKGQEAIRKELRSIKELLTSRPKARSSVEDVNLTLNVADDPAKGNLDARVMLVEFTDYQCPFCARHTKNVLPQLEKDFIETGKVRYVLRDFPLSSIHPFAKKAHEAAHCAGEQGKYWEMHDQLFANQRALQDDKLGGHAENAGVSDAQAFQACLNSGKYDEQTNSSVAEGTNAGVRGTPSFLLGLSEGNGNVKAVKLIRGAQPYAVFQKEIQSLLAPKSAGKTDGSG